MPCGWPRMKAIGMATNHDQLQKDAYEERLKSKKYKLTVALVGGAVNLLSHCSVKMAGKVALDIFAKPRLKVDPEKYQQLLAGTVQERISLDGFSYQVHRWQNEGSPKILLMHGWESNASRWARLAPKLQKMGWEVIAMDAPGHGLSDEKQFSAIRYGQVAKAVVEKYQIQALVGHSIGGTAALYAATLLPQDQIHKMVIMAAPDSLDKIYGRFEQMLSLHPKVKTGFKDAIAARFNANYDDFTSSKFAQQTKADILVLHDPKDQVAPFDEGAAIAKAADSATLVALEDVGHRMQHAKVFDQILNFFQLNN